MARCTAGSKTTCESVPSIDIRRWHRLGYLSRNCLFSWRWTRDGEDAGGIVALTEANRIVLLYKVRSHGSDWKPIEQRIPVVWTACRFGGQRPWFQCAVYSNGRYCGRRIAKLYGAGDLFACRSCHALAYTSQQEQPHYRAASQARKLWARLGGGGRYDESVPSKPKGMHWTTYERLAARADAAERYSEQMTTEWIMRHAGVR